MSGRDEGHALVEAILIGVILVAPLLWALGVLSQLHRAALAGAAAARAAGSEAASASDVAEAGRLVTRATAGAFADHGLEPTAARVRWTAPPDLPRGGRIEVIVSYPVSVLGAPLVGDLGGPSVWVRAAHVARIDPYRSRR